MDGHKHHALAAIGQLASLSISALCTLYKCELCGQQQPPRTPSNLLPIQTKTYQHPKRARVYRVKDSYTGKVMTLDDPGGVGEQIVREVRCCARCATVKAQGAVF